jgi:RimJ/RimL family protein N-acetyltransferase
MIQIRESTYADIPSFNAFVDAVAKERRYFGLVEAPPIPETAKFIAECIAEGQRQFVAIVDGKVVGAADWHRESREGFRHSANLGIGLLPAYRGQGHGHALMQAVIQGARSKGFERLQLATYSHNTHAIALYERCGFVHEGRLVRARLLDGEYSDVVNMVLSL